jgi:hypothetical protein
MKPLRLFLLATCVLLLNTSIAQTIRRVNNNPGVTGVNVYTTAQAAHDAAVANDILMIEPSSTSYGDLTLTKPLKIYGNGYLLNINTELKADQRSSKVDYVFFDTGSGGSQMAGIDVVSYVSVSDSRSISINGVSNVTIYRCRINNSGSLVFSNKNKAGTTSTSISNFFISNNFIASHLSVTVTAGYTVSNALVNNNIFNLVNNNIFNNGIYAGNNVQVQNWIVRHNTIYNAVNLANSVFENNIQHGVVSAASNIFDNVALTNNITAGSGFSGGSGNQNNYAVSSEFIGTGAGISDDEQYQLKTGSPLKTAGSAGTEVGAYGGATPYVVSGIPAIPSITSMNYTSTGSNSLPLQVTISVKSNN